MSEKSVGIQNALDKFYAYITNPDIIENYSSVSVTFTEIWTGEEQDYVIDTMTNDIQPRLLSLETGHVINGIKMAKTLTQGTIDRVVDKCSKEFVRAHEELIGAIQAHAIEKELANNDISEQISKNLD